jgi:phosphoglycerol transferase
MPMPGDQQMKTRLVDNERIKRASLYITVAALCLLILCAFLQIWRADLRVPFYYGGDAALFAMATKDTIENGSYWQNPSLGAPGTQQVYDYPTFDNAVILFLLVLSTVSHNVFLLTNLHYLISFPLITVAALYVFRQFNLSAVPAVFCSLLYAFLPYHFLRNESSLNIASYYVVPPAMLVVLWIARENLVPRTKKFIFSVVVCVLLGSSGVYFPFFFCFLLLLAGIIGALKVQSFRPAAMALALTGITAATVAINLSPSIIYRSRHSNVGVVKRAPAEAEKYGLKISQLVLPITGHRLGVLDRLKRVHDDNSFVSEDDASSLGLVGCLGFLALLAQLLRRKELVAADGLLHDLSILNIFSVLLGVVGGFGLLFALYVSSGIRAYNRVSIFIAFFSLMAVAIIVDNFYKRAARTRHIFCGLLAVVFVVAFLDQTTRGYVPTYEKTRAEFVSDQQFVNSIEASLPAGAMIFQMPYIAFPEHPKVVKMADYDHLRGYLHSNHLRWSFGAIKNRDDDLAQRRVASLAPAELAQTLAVAGFGGIYLDRYGYEDNGAALESELSRVLQTAPLVSPNGRLVFFNLAAYSARLRQRYSSSEWEVKKEFSFHPLLLDWKGGFAELETRGDKNWRWCASEGELHLRNTSQSPRTIKLEMSFATGYEQLDDFAISGLISDQFKLNDKPRFFSQTVSVPPGESIITFHSAARRVEAPLDTRVLVFRIEDFKMTELQ